MADEGQRCGGARRQMIGFSGGEIFVDEEE